MSDHVETPSLPLVDHSPTAATTCCGSWSRWTMPLMVAVCIGSLCTAAFFAGRANSLQGGVASSDLIGQLPLIDATAAVTSEKFSMATGQISEDAEGLFVLDHNSGLLQCSVIYPRMGRFMAQFTTTVGEALGSAGKGGTYMMVTGHADFPRASNRPAASTVVYVIDTTTGNYACYGVPFDHSSVNVGRQQQGILVLIATGTANPVIDRDALR